MILRVQCGITWKWLDGSRENYIIVFYYHKYKIDLSD